MTVVELSVLRPWRSPWSVGLVICRMPCFEWARACARGDRAAHTLDPFLLHSVAFWLSCGASAGIVLLLGPLRATSRAGMVALPAPAVSLAAQVGVTPVLLTTFGSVPLVTPIVSCCVPAAEAVGVYGMLASAILGGTRSALVLVLQQPSKLFIALGHGRRSRR